MARPSIEERVRKAVGEYLAHAENLSAEEASLNALAVAARLDVDRKILKKYHLDEDIAAASQRQGSRGKPSPKEIEQRAIQNRFKALHAEIASMRGRCEALIERVCIAEGNAQRLGVDPAELWKPLTLSNRSLPHIGGRRRKGPARR